MKIFHTDQNIELLTKFIWILLIFIVLMKIKQIILFFKSIIDNLI
jgi:hypothetical protein